MLAKIHEFLVYWDYTIWYYLNTQWVTDFLDFIVPFIRNQWTWAPLYLFLLIFMPLNFGRKGWMWLLFFILCFGIGDFVSASIIKPYFMRPRPCNNPYIQDITHLLVHCGSGYSFPFIPRYQPFCFRHIRSLYYKKEMGVVCRHFMGTICSICSGVCGRTLSWRCFMRRHIRCFNRLGCRQNLLKSIQRLTGYLAPASCFSSSLDSSNSNTSINVLYWCASRTFP